MLVMHLDGFKHLHIFPLSQHDFVRNAQPCSILHKMISEAREIQAAQKLAEDEQDEV